MARLGVSYCDGAAFSKGTDMALQRPLRPFTGPELCAKPARVVVELLRKREVSPREALAASWARMDAVEPKINATVIRDDERALASLTKLPARAARNGDHIAWLAGLPVGIKDLIPVAGMRGTAGSPALVDFVASESDALIDRLEVRGAVIAGKTNTPEFGAGGNATNAVFGSTRNPWNTTRNAGGSSGGAAASLAAGEVWLSHGSDLAGSLRTPAALCGVIGFRPTPGRAGGAPADSAFQLEAVQGPMARDIRDTALFLDAMCGFDPRHPLSFEEPLESFQAVLNRNPGPIKIGFSEDQNGFGAVEPEIRAVLRSAMASLEGEGIVIEDTCPELPFMYETYTTLRGMHYASVVARMAPEIQKHFKSTLRQNRDQGLALTADQIHDAARCRTDLYHRMRRFLGTYDVLAIPVVGIAAQPVEQEYPPYVADQKIDDYVDWLRFSFLSVVTALPALSMPVGFTDAGLPVGLQLIGPARGEARLLQVALAIEERLALGAMPVDPF